MEERILPLGYKEPNSHVLKGVNDIFARTGEWLSANGLKLNSDKAQDITCTLSHTITPGAETMKLLDVTINTKLLWNQHIDAVCLKLVHVTYLL
ncbi:hypothetical protein J6590_032772 [Homalodisca vitripennis]|nr:hypothetical protein J6590_032772 [Homalodisca vitripennis]